MNENNQCVNTTQNLRETIPTGEGENKDRKKEMPEIKRKSEEKRTMSLGMKITPSNHTKLERIAEQENATLNSVINWLIEVEAAKRGIQ